MPRVISGTVGGVHLKSPKGVELRPTQDRVKQALFSSLGDRVVEASVLDLYAGTGSCGIEALSRGAASAVFVEKERRCVECIRENLKLTGFSGEVIGADALRYLSITPPKQYQIVFADPPYEKQVGNLDQHPLMAAVRPWVAEGGLFIFEHFSKWICREPEGWGIVDVRKYGETTLTLLVPRFP